MTDTHLDPATLDPLEVVRRGAPVDGEPVRMMPAEAYTSPEVLAWERRHLFAGSWTCLGRADEVLPEQDARSTTQRSVMVGDVSCLLVRDAEQLRLFANTCRHRGHELLPADGSSSRRSIQCPYHAWTYDLGGRLIGAKGFVHEPGFEADEYALVELPVQQWQGWVFAHAAHELGHPEVP